MHRRRRTVARAHAKSRTHGLTHLHTHLVARRLAAPVHLTQNGPVIYRGWLRVRNGARCAQRLVAPDHEPGRGEHRADQPRHPPQQLPRRVRTLGCKRTRTQTHTHVRTGARPILLYGGPVIYYGRHAQVWKPARVDLHLNVLHTMIQMNIAIVAASKSSAGCAARKAPRRSSVPISRRSSSSWCARWPRAWPRPVRDWVPIQGIRRFPHAQSRLRVAGVPTPRQVRGTGEGAHPADAVDVVVGPKSPFENQRCGFSVPRL